MILILAYLILRSPKRWAGRLIGFNGLSSFILGAAAVWLIGSHGTRAVEHPSFRGIGIKFFRLRPEDSLVPGCHEFRRVPDGNGWPTWPVARGVLSCSSQRTRTSLSPRCPASAPPAILVVPETFGMKTGASAPLWIEGVLNQGAVGDFLSMVVFAGLWGLLFRGQFPRQVAQEGYRS